jgi:hypothetical protein
MEIETEAKIIVKLTTRFGQAEIEGTPQAVQEILAGIGLMKSPAKQQGNKTVKILLEEMVVSGWFDHPRTLSDIKHELEKKGYDLPTSSITPVLLRDFIRKNLIDRTGTKRTYSYFTDPKKIENFKKTTK